MLAQLGGQACTWAVVCQSYLVIIRDGLMQRKGLRLCRARDFEMRVCLGTPLPFEKGKASHDEALVLALAPCKWLVELRKGNASL